MADPGLRHAAWTARCIGRGELSPFADRELAELALHVGKERLEAGAPMMTERRPIAQIGVIHSGEVELYRRTGARRVVLQVLRDGDVFGDIPFLCHKPAPFSARALTATEVTWLDADTLWHLLETRPHVCRRFLFSVASRLERMQRRLLELTAGDLRQQVAALLLDETAGAIGEIRLSQATIAELLGATRPSVNRVLKELESDGLLALSYRRVRVTDPEGLLGVAAA